MKIAIFIFLLVSFMSCKHPESSEYEPTKNSPTVERKTDLSSLNVNLQVDSTVNLAPVETAKGSIEEENSIDMESINGVKYVWVEINGLRLKFIFDTGASSISISPAEATVMYRQGTLTREDILDKEYFQDATGNISEGTVVNLRTVKIGSLVLENIRATVVDSEEAPLLLGQSVFEKFGKIEIDNQKNQIIFK